MGAPHFADFVDWSSGSPGAVVRRSFTAQTAGDEILQFEDSCLAIDAGPAEVTELNSAAVMGQFNFVAIRIKSVKTGLHQIGIACYPATGWPSYPFADTMPAGAAVLTHPSAFKVIIRDQAEAILHTFQSLRTGLPINDPSTGGDRNPHPELLEPRWGCGMVLVWNEAPIPLHSSVTRYHPGFVGQLAHHGKSHYSSNPALPLLAYGNNGRAQTNGFNHWYGMPGNPLPSFEGVLYPAPGGYGTGNAVSPNADPSVVDPTTVYTGDNGYRNAFWATGYLYNHGSISGHDWYTGPGGLRYDRGAIAEPYAHLFTNQSYVRPKAGESIDLLSMEWGKAYFNHSGHWVNSKRFASPVSAIQQTGSFMTAYYGTGPFAPLSQSIDLRAIQNGSSAGDPAEAAQYDATGQRIWNGWAVDDNHLHQTPYIEILTRPSHLHVIAARSAYSWSFLSRLSDRKVFGRPIGAPWYGPSYGSALNRRQAWRYLHHVLAWKTGTTHHLGVSQSTALANFTTDLEDFHDDIVVVANSGTTDPYYTGLKNLGIPLGIDSNNNSLFIDGSGLVYYMTDVFLLLKTTGMWTLLVANTKAKISLEFIMECLDKYSIDFILDTAGQFEDSSAILPPQPSFAAMIAATPTSWASAHAINPVTGQFSWTKRSDGTYIERASAQHLRARWAKLRQDWFPEYPHPRVAAAISTYNAYYSDWDSNGQNWSTRHWKDTYFKSPAQVGVTINPTTGAASCATCVVTITSGITASGTSGTAGSFQATATGGTAPYSWSLPGAPAGVSINASSGLISWTAAVPSGVYTFSITVTDSASATDTDSFTLTLAVAVAIPAQTLPTGVIGLPYDYVATATPSGGAWSISPSVAGWSINASTGAITGTPAAAATNLTVVYTVSGQPSVSRVLTVPAISQGNFVVSNVIYQSLSKVVSLTGTLPINCTPTGMPAGMSFNPATFTFSAPANSLALGATNVSLTCTNCATGTDTKTFTVRVLR